LEKTYLTYKYTRTELDFEFFKIQTYFQENIKQLISRKKELKKFLNEDIKQNPDDIDIIQEAYSKDILLNNFFPNILLGSTIVNILSYLESALSQICEDYIDFVNSEIKLKHINGTNNIERTRIFIKVVINVEIHELDKYWNIISDFWKIRNCIVHQNYKVKNWNLLNSKHDLFKIISKYKDISVNEKSERLEILGSKNIAKLLNSTKLFVDGTMRLIEDCYIIESKQTRGDISLDFDYPPF